MPLCARDLLSDAVVTVEAEARLCDVASSIGECHATHVAVFDEGEFLSLVRLQDILLSSPDRIFADLTPTDPAPCVNETMPADEVAAVMCRSAIDAVSVFGPDKSFGGAITNASLLRGKLDQAENWRNQSERLVRSLEKDRTQLRAILETANTANKAKSEFLANMSHEIRAPMTAVLGYTDVLMEHDTTDSEKLNSVLTIRRNGEHLLNVINDILDLSKLEAQKLTLECIACDPLQVLQDARDLLPLYTVDERPELTLKAVGAIPTIIRTDPTRVRQMLVNLVGNATKFGRRAPVHVAIECDAKKEELTFRVVDCGIGMSKKQIQLLFNPFTQGDKSTVRRFGGSGLGLAITRHLARLLGGDVKVESKVNQGSTFSLTIATGPLKGVKMVRPGAIPSSSARASQPRKSQPKLSGRVLLVEDGVDNQRLISWILTKAGADVTLAHDGQEGVDMVIGPDHARRRTDAHEPFDIVIMDMQMPVMDGYEATKILRSSGYEGQIIALTADAMKEEVVRCLEVGCDLHLPKPIQRDLLLEEMAKRMGKRSERAKSKPNDPSA